MQAITAFQKREGHARVPGEHVEVLPGEISVALATWCTKQRFDYRHGAMPADRAARLGQVPGWLWEIQPTPRISIDIGDSRHGTRVGYVKGCRCLQCTTANRVQARARAARAAAGLPSSDLVSATRVCGHLRILEGQGATRKGMARAAELNVQTITNLIDGRRSRILADTAHTLLGLTLEQVRAAAAPGVQIPAAATWALVEDLTGRGWPKSWIARELGMGRTLQLSRDQVTVGNATKIADLHARVAGRTAPPRRRGVPTPPLDQVGTDLAHPA